MGEYLGAALGAVTKSECTFLVLVNEKAIKKNIK